MLHRVGERQAVPERFRSVLAALIEMVSAGDVAAMRASPVILVGDGDPLLWVRDYPGAVVPLPAEGWALADAIQVSGHPGLWSVVIPLWTATEGTSDLTLEATIEDRAEGPVVTIGNIHVM
jgi:hypothetical protein